MADLKLKSIQIRNWMKFRNVHLKLPERGLVVVTGHNLASKGSLQSVGSGKTGFGEAICHTLLGVSSHFDRVGDYSLDANGDTYVRLDADFLGKPLTIEMGYKCKELKSGGEALQYTYDGSAPKSRGRVEQTRDDLLKLLGVPQLLARWTVFVDGDDLKFNKLSQADSVELVMSALRQPPWNDYYEASKKALGKFKQAMAKDQAAHEQASQRLREAQEDVKDAQAEAKAQQQAYAAKKVQNDKVIREHSVAIAAKNARLTAQQERRQTIAKLVEESVQAKAGAYHQLEMEANAINDRIQSLQARNRPLSVEKDAAVKAHTQAETAFSNYQNSDKKICPTCRKPWTEKIDPARLAQLQEAMDTAQAFADGKQKACDALQTKLQAQRDLLEQNRQKTAALGAEEEIEKLRSEDEELEESASTLQNDIHRLQTALNTAKTTLSDTALKEAQATLRERQRVLEQATAAVNDAATEMANSGAMLGVLEYWNMAFSPYGIPNMVLRDAIAPLNREAKRVSAVMTGGTIDVTYDTRKELASGMEKAQLVVKVDNKLGSQDLRGSSKGEAGLTNFIIAETLSEVGQISRRIGFRWYDEVLPNQDPVVCKSIYQYLRQVSNRLGIVTFLVTHDPNAANYADHVLVVKKSGTAPDITGTAKFIGQAELD